VSSRSGSQTSFVVARSRKNSGAPVEGGQESEADRAVRECGLLQTGRNFCPGCLVVRRQAMNAADDGVEEPSSASICSGQQTCQLLLWATNCRMCAGTGRLGTQIRCTCPTAELLYGCFVADAAERGETAQCPS
jgi:hypothetical protein